MGDPPAILVLVPIILSAIPIVAMVLRYRHKELELRLRAEKTPNPNQQVQIDVLQSEMKEMKHMMQEQMIAVDTFISNQARLLEGPRPSDLQNRLGQTTEQTSEAKHI